MTVEVRMMEPSKDWQAIGTAANLLACYDSCGVVAADSETGEIHGAWVFDSFTQDTARCHMWFPHLRTAIKAGLMEASAEYIYGIRDRLRVFGYTPRSNPKAVAMAIKIGGRHVATIPHGYEDDDDYIVTEMTPESCTWYTQGDSDGR